MNMELLKETVGVGILTVVVGMIISTLWMRASEGKWPRTHLQLQVAGSLFITGAVIHLVCEFTGINKWYCKNGVACQKR
jgi:hypothetical protein